MNPHDSANDPTQFPQDAAASEATGPRLSDADARLLDRLVDARFELTAMVDLSADDRVRAARLLGQLDLLDAYPEEGHLKDDALLDATLARIDREAAARASRMRIDPERAVSIGRRLRLPDLVAVASIAILAAVVLVPLINWRNARALDLRCDNNMRLIAEGIEGYTQSFQGTMPMAVATASILPDVGSWLGYRNADNLTPLKAGAYCSEGCLCCPGDHDPSGCYAYQVVLGERRPQWQHGPRVAVVGDRNPLVDLKRNGETIASVALNSASHGGRGQNLLFSDGSISFVSSPYLPLPESANGPGNAVDNIWLPFGNRPDALTQRPGEGVDAFLLH